MATLERREAGGFALSQSYTIDELEKMNECEREELFIPTESLFEGLERVTLSPFYEKLCRNGCEIYLKKIRKDLPIGTRVTLWNEEGIFFALGEVREYSEGKAIKSIKAFDV